MRDILKIDRADYNQLTLEIDYITILSRFFLINFFISIQTKPTI